MIRPDHLLEHVIVPVLMQLNLRSPSAERLLLGIAAQESHLGTYLDQHPTGPAMGIYQMEGWVHDGQWDHYLSFRPEIAERIWPLTMMLTPDYTGKWPAAETLRGNLYYATAMARIKLRRVPEALPAADDVPGLAAYWNQYWNANPDAGTDAEFIHNYHRFVTPYLTQ